MASNVEATNTCTSSTMTGHHAGWGQSVTITMDGEQVTVSRPDGWWEQHGAAPWPFTVTFDDPAGVWSWTDHEASGEPQGGGVLELAAECSAPTTTVPCQEDEPCWDCTTMGNLVCAPPTTLAPVVPLPELVVDPTVPPSVPLPNYVAEPLPQLPVGVEVTVDPYSTLPAGVTTSVAENGDVVYSDCVIVEACNDPMFDVVAEVGTSDTLPATGPLDFAPWIVFAVGLIAVGRVCLRLQRYPRTVR